MKFFNLSLRLKAEFLKTIYQIYFYHINLFSVHKFYAEKVIESLMKTYW